VSNWNQRFADLDEQVVIKVSYLIAGGPELKADRRQESGGMD